MTENDSIYNLILGLHVSQQVITNAIVSSLIEKGLLKKADLIKNLKTLRKDNYFNEISDNMINTIISGLENKPSPEMLRSLFQVIDGHKPEEKD